MKIRQTIAIVGIVGLLPYLVACNPSVNSSPSLFTSTPTPTPTPGAGGNGSIIPSPTPPNTTGLFKISTTFADPYAYSVLHLDSDWTKGCEVDVSTSATSTKDIKCILEVEELDLYFNKISMAFTSPALGCPYVSVRPYWFYQLEPGTGPSTVSYNVNSDTGLVTSLVTNTGDAYIDTTTNPQTVRCNFDHKEDGNCCSGDYLATVTTTSGTTATVTAQSKNWGGKWGNCANGPGASTTFSRASFENLPVKKYHSMYAGGSWSFDITSAISQSLSSNLFSSNFLANQNSPPSPMAPPAFASAFHGSQYYDFGCLDAAEDYLARVRVMVRRWTTRTELAKGSSGNPDLAGSESPFPGQVSDRSSWDEFIGLFGLTAYPGNGL